MQKKMWMPMASRMRTAFYASDTRRDAMRAWNRTEWQATPGNPTAKNYEYAKEHDVHDMQSELLLHKMLLQGAPTGWKNARR